MKVINLNSKFELTQAQISFAESVIICGEDGMRECDSISILMNEIPVLLVDIKTQEKYGYVDGGRDRDGDGDGDRDGDVDGDILGFYQHSTRILGAEMPVIGLCLEKIINAVKTDEELVILITQVLIHEFAHAKMKLHSRANYYPIDEFYNWMEEPMANLITLEIFKHYEISNRHFHIGFCRHREKKLACATTLISPFAYVKDFISKQPDNYRLGLDLFDHRVNHWWIWSNQKDKIQKKTKEKQDWLHYVKANVGRTEKVMLEKLFEKLHK